MELFAGFLFKGLSEEQSKRVKDLSAEVSVKKRERIFKEGEKAESVYILKGGAIELTTKVEKGFELPISILRVPGDVAGSSALVPPFLYSLSARCVEAGSLLKIDRSSIIKLMEEDRHVERLIMTNLAENFLARLKETRQELKIHFKILLKSTRT
jgi:CRP/FNR family cyclic AMP-dependent transcriptional regulator